MSLRTMSFEIAPCVEKFNVYRHCARSLDRTAPVAIMYTRVFGVVVKLILIWLLLSYLKISFFFKKFLVVSKLKITQLAGLSI